MTISILEQSAYFQEKAQSLLSKTAIVGSLAALSLISVPAAFAADGLLFVDEDTQLSEVQESFGGVVAVGAPGGATLTIENGSIVDAEVIGAGFTGEPDFGIPAGDQGAIVVTGEETEASATGIYLGVGGEGTLSVLNGGTVSAELVVLGTLDGGSGTINVEGENSLLQTLETYIGEETGTSGQVSVSDGGTLFSGLLSVGSDGGDGSFSISNGGQAATITGIVGEGNGSTGVVTISGEGSSWDLVSVSDAEEIAGIPQGTLFPGGFDGDPGILIVGMFEGATGTVNITDGGSVSSIKGFVGGHASYASGEGGTGVVNVSGENSRWDNSNVLVVGTSGNGSLNIKDGGTVTALASAIGDEEGATGAVSVTGDGANLTISDEFVVGYNGQGSLTVNKGGTVTASYAVIGGNKNSSGSVSVSGTETSLLASDYLLVGYEGQGSLTISDGAVVSVQDGEGTVYLADMEDSTGTINIGAAKGEEAVAAGYLEAAAVQFGEGEGLLVFNHTNEDYLFDTSLTGLNVAFEFISGETILGGDNSDVEASVEAGSTLSVNGTLGDIEVLEDGILGGSGTVKSIDVQSGGRVAPGNSIGTLTVTGNTGFSDNTFYDVEIDEAGNSDKLDVTGAVTIANNVEVNVTPEDGNTGSIDYIDGSQYTIIEAAGGVIGTFSSVVDNLYFFDTSLSYDANSVYLDLARNSLTFVNAAQTSNQRAVGGSLNGIGAGPLNAAVLGLSSGEIGDAYDQLSGDIYASVNNILLEDSRFLRSAVLEESNTGGRLFWGKAYGAWGSWDSDGNAAGVDRNAGGLIVGIDTHLTETLSAGLTAGYGHTSIDDDSVSSASVDSYHIGVYGAGSFGDASLKAGLTYSYNQIDSERDVRFGSLSEDLSANYNAGTFQVFTEAGYDLDTSFATLTPFAGLAYVNVNSDGFSESGGDAVLAVNSASDGTAITNLGLRINKAFDLSGANVAVSGSIAWQRIYGNSFTSDNAFTGGNSFSVSGVPTNQDSAVMNAGVSMMFSENTQISLSYDALLSSDVQDQSVKAVLKAQF
ncbi:Extracellular serine protease precursor [Pseudovibrio axinellae]|uniref:Extracellular serine protease n=1 Tax=Pseudovibrio axinellae TaxID=989403 RepID=A0A165ULG3_9HYPH|nr:autotransporter domain-containing protein [Pseudovibrio axinellae]KZL12511.1 Extracellular serine protease precursor [Pseudovibrio axinellae]SEP69069.1 outer membrane autotransporter barrel domain-containing protein [Pseudovibrio axinellae]